KERKMSMNGEETLMALLFGFMAFFAVIALIGFILYFFKAIGLFKLAKKEGRGDLAWLGWVPVVNTVLMMLLLEKSVHESFRNNLTLIYGISIAATEVLSSFGAGFISFIACILFFYAIYFLAKRYSINQIQYIVIAIIIFSGYTIISIFMFRNKQPVDTTGMDVIDTPYTEDNTNTEQ